MKIDSVNAYVHMRRDAPLTVYASAHILHDPLPSIPPVVHILVDVLFLNQKTNKNIWLSYSSFEKISLRKNRWYCRIK